MSATQQEYLENNGNACPNCDSQEISASVVEFDDTTAWREVVCDECGSTWADVYQLQGYEDLEKGDE
jgi:formate dehydrogenase maturation protein FdhE